MAFPSLSTNDNGQFRALNRLRAANFLPRLRTNQLPSTLERAEISQLLTDGEADQLRYRAQMARHRAVLAALENQSASLASHMDVCRSLLTPIRKLPPEILRSIFRDSCPAGNEDSAIQMPAATLGMVCSHWRDIVLSTTELWSDITLDLDADNMEDPRSTQRLIELFLQRAGGSPLDVAIRRTAPGGNCEPALRALAQHSLKWRNVQLVVTADILSCPALSVLSDRLDALETLDIQVLGSSNNATIDIFRLAPKLHTVAIDGLAASRFTLPTASIKNFSIGRDDITDFPTIITQFPHVISIRLANPVNPMQHPAVSLVPTTLNVRDFHLLIEEGRETIPHASAGIWLINAIFRAITFPSVTSLTLQSLHGFDGQGEFPWASFTRSLSQSFPILTSINLERLPLSEANLIALLPLIPALEEIRITEHCSKQTITELFLKALNVSYPSGLSTPHLPKLTNISFTVEGDYFQEDAFASMIMSRWSPEGAHSTEGGTVCLKSVYLRILTRVVDIVAIAPVMDIGATGTMDVTVISLPIPEGLPRPIHP